MKNVTRSFTSTSASVKLYNEASDTIETVKVSLDGKLDADTFKKAYAVRESRVVLKVFDIETIEELRGIPEDAFITNGTAFSERDKTNRGMVSKTVSTNCYLLKVWNENTDSMEEKTVTAETLKAAEKQLSTNYKLLKVMSETKVESLICMSVEDFKRYSRPMIDHFHYKQ